MVINLSDEEITPTNKSNEELDDIDVCKQRLKRYDLAFKHLLDLANEQLDKNDDTDFSANMLAIQIARIIYDSQRYSFD